MYFLSLFLDRIAEFRGRDAGGHDIAEERHGDLAVGTDHVRAAELGAAVNQNRDLVLGAENEGMVVLGDRLRGVFDGFIARRRQLCRDRSPAAR